MFSFHIILKSLSSLEHTSYKPFLNTVLTFLSFPLLKIATPGLSCPGALLQFPLIFQPRIFQFSTNWQCSCSLHAHIFPFFCHVLLLLLQCISVPFSVCRNLSLLWTLSWKLSSSVSFLIRPGLTGCNLLHVSS